MSEKIVMHHNSDFYKTVLQDKQREASTFFKNERLVRSLRDNGQPRPHMLTAIIRWVGGGLKLTHKRFDRGRERTQALPYNTHRLVLDVDQRTGHGGIETGEG